MDDQIFTYGHDENHTSVEITKTDPDLCEAVIKTDGCDNHHPEDSELDLLSVERPICESKVSHFIEKWDTNMKAEFREIIGSPEIQIKQVHPQSTVPSNGDNGVFIRYFIKKCIFNMKDSNASSYNIELFASIFPFKVSETVPPAQLAVSRLFDEEFFADIVAFMVRHFESTCDSAFATLDLFLRNIYHFREQHFTEHSVCELKNVLDDAEDPEKSSLVPTYINAYLKEFPRLSLKGVARYLKLRRMYDVLCASFGCEELCDQGISRIQMLPEINCYELLLLLEPDFFSEQRAKYVELYQKYLFFFVYAIRSPDNPVFFIDEPLFECLKSYTQYRCSREAPEDLKLCIWLITLVHRRTQRLIVMEQDDHFKVDDENLRHVQSYVEKFPGIESAVLDFVQPTSLMLLGISMVIKDTVLRVFYSKRRKSKISDFYDGIIRAALCPLDIKKVVIYNAYNGVEASMLVPAVKKEVLEFVRRYNRYDPARPIPAEYKFTYGFEYCFEEDTIQWDKKCTKKSNPLPVHDYRNVLGDA